MFLLIVIGGVRFGLGLAGGTPIDAETTIALLMLSFGVFWGLRAPRQ